MNKYVFIVTGLLLTLFLTAPSGAELLDRGNGLIYDDILDITWLEYANYSGETMTWDEAMSWADTFDFQGYDDWRLPASDTSCIDDTCWESEMDYLFHVEGITSTTPGQFSDVNPYMYWSATDDSTDPSKAWRFNFKFGTRGVSTKTSTRYAWAVRDGDSTPPVIPEPTGLVLIIAGGLTLAAGHFRKK